MKDQVTEELPRETTHAHMNYTYMNLYLTGRRKKMQTQPAAIKYREWKIGWQKSRINSGTTLIQVIDGSWRTYKWVMLHIWMSLVAEMRMKDCVSAKSHQLWDDAHPETNINESWPNHVCDMTHSQVWCDSFQATLSWCLSRQIEELWPIHMCDMTHKYLWSRLERIHTSRWHARHASCMHTCDMFHFNCDNPDMNRDLLYLQDLDAGLAETFGNDGQGVFAGEDATRTIESSDVLSGGAPQVLLLKSQPYSQFV